MIGFGEVALESCPTRRPHHHTTWVTAQVLHWELRYLCLESDGLSSGGRKITHIFLLRIRRTYFPERISGKGVALFGVYLCNFWSVNFMLSPLFSGSYTTGSIEGWGACDRRYVTLLVYPPQRYSPLMFFLSITCGKGLRGGSKRNTTTDITGAYV